MLFLGSIKHACSWLCHWNRFCMHLAPLHLFIVIPIPLGCYSVAALSLIFEQFLRESLFCTLEKCIVRSFKSIILKQKILSSLLAYVINARVAQHFYIHVRQNELCPLQNNWILYYRDKWHSDFLQLLICLRNNGLAWCCIPAIIAILES